MSLSKMLLVVLLVILSACGNPPAEDPESRSLRLGKEIRCPVCRGVPIADSPSELSRQMMDLVRQQVKEGKSDQEILQFFEERYGEWALLEPKARGMNWVVWVLPFVVLIGGGVFIVAGLRRKKKREES